MTTAPAATEIHLEVHICDQRRSYRVVFTGPQAEDHALAFIDSRAGTRNHAISEWLVTEEVAVLDEYAGEFLRWGSRVADDQPYLVDGNTFPRLYDKLHPTCHHGMSADLCMDPIGESHFGTREQEMAWVI